MWPLAVLAGTLTDGLACAGRPWTDRRVCPGMGFDHICYWLHHRIEAFVTALYIAGERDMVLGFGGTDKLLASLKQLVPNLRQTLILPGCGHWTQQERPAEVNAAVLEFLRAL